MRPKDVPGVHAMLRELAVFEDLEHQLTADEKDLHDAIFISDQAEALVAEADTDSECRLVGYAIYFHNFSTFLCRRGLYLEDLYVRPDFRRRGVGKSFLSRLAEIALERQCGRFEWSVLDWNQNAIDVYETLGGTILPDWRIVRLEPDAIRNLAERS